MKTKVKNPKMKPITVIIEKPNELHDLCEVLFNCDWERYPNCQELYNNMCVYTSVYPREEVKDEGKETDSSEATG